MLLKSDATEAELLAVIDRPALVRLIAPAARARLIEVIAATESVPITDSVAVCRDPKDDKFLALAISGNADAIVTDDADLLC